MRGPVVITGGTGFVGRRVTAALTDLRVPGLEIYWLAKDDKGQRVPSGPGGGPIFRKVDLTDCDSVDGLIADIRPATVLHLIDAWHERRRKALELPAG